MGLLLTAVVEQKETSLKRPHRGRER
jgi:hypothetical protein